MSLVLAGDPLTKRGGALLSLLVTDLAGQPPSRVGFLVPQQLGQNRVLVESEECCQGLAVGVREAGQDVMRFNVHEPAPIVGSGLLSASEPREPDPLVGPARCSSSQPCEHSSGAGP
jgi:hypothetical protein